MSVDAACRIVGTAPPEGGYIIVCDESDTTGITGSDFHDIITVESGAEVSKTVQQTGTSSVHADAIVLDAGRGNDTVMNLGAIDASASGSATTNEGGIGVTAGSTGIECGEGDDTISNSGTMGTSSYAEAILGSGTINALGDSSVAAGTNATAETVGISGGTGSDAITNTHTITATATAEANAGTFELNLLDTASADAGVAAEATAVGIAGNDSDGIDLVSFDTIINSGTITADASAQADSSGFRIQAVDWAVALATSSAESAAIGIKGGPGSNGIENSGDILCTAAAQSDLWTVELNLSDWGLASSGLTLESEATGIEGGDLGDEITNSGSITVSATSEGDRVSVNFTLLDVTVLQGAYNELLGNSVAGADTLSDASAKGIEGAGGGDTISNTGTIDVSATAVLDGTAVSIGAEGIPKSLIDVLKGRSLASSSPTADGSVSGIAGGAGDDCISNIGSIEAAATATATDISVNLSLPLLEKIMPFPSPSFALGGAGTTARATATGIEGGAGNDVITHQAGLIDVDATSETLGVTASAALQGVISGIKIIDLQSAVADVSIQAESVSTGIDGGVGNDTVSIGSQGTVDSHATATADGISVGLGIQGKIDDALNIGVSLARADTTASATATGIRGGEGDDTIGNAGDVTTSADSSALTVGVSVEAELAVKNALSVSGAFVDTSTRSDATATGISGNEDVDDITNSGKITVTATPDADSTDVGVDFQNVEEGLAAGVSYVDASTTADAVALGIDGGSGNDAVINTSTGEITVTADSESTSAGVGVTLAGSFSQEWSGAIGGAITKGTTLSTADASGISGGDGYDRLTNAGKITAHAFSDSDAASVSVGLVGAQDGLTLGFTYADSTTTAQAHASGMNGGSGNDTLINTGTGEIEITADPESSSASVGVTLTGVTKGTGIVGGAALADGTTKAIATAEGINGGDGDDSITNMGSITLSSNPDADSASVTVNLGAAAGELGLVGGFSYADAATTAQATVIGIDGGAGSETVTNTGSITVTATPNASSASVGVTAQGVKGMGAAAGVSLTDGTTTAIASATGMAGSGGDDTLTNSGSITVNALPDADSASVSVSISAAQEGVAAGGTFADATTTAEATAAGTEGGAGNDTIGNSGTIEVTADAESSSASVGVSAAGTMTGVGLGVALADGTTKAVSNAAGITGGEGADTITNSRTITATSTADIAGASVTLNLGGAETGLVLGVAAADISSTADSTAWGIEAGSGDDTVVNFGDLTTSALSTISAASVSVNAGVAVNGVAAGAALADGTTTAASKATGLEGGFGTDTLINLGDNEVSATSEVHAASVAVDIEGTSAGLAAGASLVDGENTASAFAAGIGGGEGDDAIGNYQTTSATAVTNSTRTNVSVTGTFSLYGVALGAALADAANTAVSDARGIDGSAGDDTVTNGSGLTADASTTASTTSVAVSIDVAVFGVGAGASMTNAETTGSALATGITGGAGNDVIENTADGAITATTSAVAGARAVSVSVAHASLTTAEAATEATAGSTGITGGDGQDSILNRGAINLSASSDTDATAAAAQLIGYGDAQAGAVSTACATGIDGSGGNDTLTNAATGTITNFATGTVTKAAQATADASSYNIQLAGGANATAGTTATASAVGIAGGSGTDIVRNDGAIDLSTEATLVSSSRSVQIMGVGLADAHSDATARVIGIDGGEGADTMTNSSSGSIAVTSSADATATGVSATIGITGVSAATTSYARSTGIEGGGETDTVYNHGSIQATTSSSTTAAGGSFSLAGLSSGDSLTQAHALGIDTGDGDDTIVNSGTIEAGCMENDDPPLAYSEVASVSFSFFGISSASFGSSAWATGISGGNGDDAILNTGTVTVGDQDWMAEGLAFGFTGNFFGFFEMASVGARADTVSAGIDGGDGNDTILNDTGGALGVLATSYAESEGSGDTTFGSTAAFASSTTAATGTGIDGANGNDAIGNRGTITAAADTLAHSYAIAEAGWGSPKSDAAATVTATASGINAGAGLNLVVNEGEIHADSSAVATPVSHADSDIGVTDAESSAQVHAAAYGVLSGDEGSTVTNQASGTIDVTASAGTDDGQGTLLRASGDEKATATAGSASSPITASASGIALGAGADCVTNDGTITAGASSSPIAQAYTDSWPNHATSSATTYSSAVAKGIAAGGGANVITNTGRIDISAWGHGNPIVDAWSRDDTADAHATADAKAAATGIEGQGSILNASTGDIEVNARAMAYADADNEAEDTAAAAGLTASAAGVSTDTDTLDAGQDDFVRNDGSLTVRALAGEDEDGQPQNILYANGVLWVRSNQASGTGTVNADAAGIRTGNRDAHIMNTGTMDVLAREHANIYVRAFSEDYTNHANADSIGNAAATGIRGEDGRYLILNTELGNVVVGAEANAAANCISDTDGPRYAAATSTATAAAQADGVLVGEGGNTMTNAGTIDVVSSAFTDTDSLADAGTSSHGTAISTSTSEADASGIRTGSGKNRIVNSGEITVEARAGADAYAYSDDDGWGGDAEISITTATASAQAYGILTGDGNSVVINTGTIDVSAETEASAVNDTEDYGRSAGTRQMSETAIGIRTGSGNDTITNEGTIIATRTQNSVSSSGLAIQTGAGNDTVILGEGSQTSGGIELGEGDDTLKFVGQSAVNSAIDSGAGSDSLVFEGTGNLDCTFAGFESARKDGPGVFTLESLPTMNRLELNGGTLRIDSDYSMAEGSVFRTTVRGDGSFGQLRVAGTAGLAGDLDVVKGTGPFLDATTYDIITADAVSDAFGTVMLPAANNFVSFEVHQSPTLIQVEANVKDFAWLAGNPVERSVAGYLDRILPDATGDLSMILARIQGLSEPEFAKALSSLSSDTYDALTTTNISLVGQHTNSLQSRMNRVRSYQYARRSDQEKPILLAYAGSNPGLFRNPEKISQLQGKSGLWFDAARQWGDQDGMDGFTGYDFSMDGATLGFDHEVGDGLIAGISIGCSRADVDFDHQQGDGSIKSRIGSVYGSYFSRNLSIDGALSYGRNGYDSHRLITVGQLQERASSDHDGDFFSAYLKTGYYHELNTWLVGPFASLQYISLDEESFTEEGAGSLNLKMDGRRSSALVSEFGLCLARVIEVKYGSLVPELTASWLHDFDIDDRMITSSFAGSPGTAFSIRGNNAEKNGATLGAGATFIHQNGISTSVQYKGWRRENCTSQGVMGEIRYAF